MTIATDNLSAVARYLDQHLPPGPHKADVARNLVAARARLDLILKEMHDER